MFINGVGLPCVYTGGIGKRSRYVGLPCVYKRCQIIFAAEKIISATAELISTAVKMLFAAAELIPARHNDLVVSFCPPHSL